MMAVMHRLTTVVRDLIAAHADVNARDNEGRIAIDYADPSDRDTVSALKKAGSKKPTGHSGRIACDAEVALNKLGSDFIVDCISDRDLDRAIEKFQQTHGLNPSGQMDSATLKALGVRP